MHALRQLGHPSLLGLAQALEAGRLKPPYRVSAMRKYVPSEHEQEVTAELVELQASGMRPAHIATLARLLAEERASSQAITDRLELVWSGLTGMPSQSRDTGVVVQQLFREAKKSVLIASFAVDKGAKAEALFGTLAQRMDEDPELQVRLFLNVHRTYGDETSATVLLHRFAKSFTDEIWPGERMPEVYHDPRSLETGGYERSCLHAKCIVVDDERALISSANFTEAAQERNIEAGVLVADDSVAERIRWQFEGMIEAGVLVQVAGVGG